MTWKDFFKIVAIIIIGLLIAGAEWQSKQQPIDIEKEVAISFADWLSGEGYIQYDGVGRWIAPHNNNNVYTTKQLYEQF